MASGPGSAAGKVGPEWDVGPMEDVVQALMETLVDPLLPLRVSNVPPSEDVQKSVAKQMHVVVLLYNYYHRKQKPELLFLDFVYFCKLAMVIRPPLIAFMKVMNDSKLMELNDAEDQFSVTEKAIKDACDIAVALDASRDVPNTEGWPISKVSVLLIDSKKEHCMLQFGNVTKGAWSLIEKELNDSSINPELSAEKVGTKRKREEILQLAYDVTKDVTGIDSSGLEVLESHVTYSLSKEKSATCFYMMQCLGSITKNEQVPLKFLVESLQGPLAQKLPRGFWKTTPVVEYHHLLPYVEIISHWLSGINLCLPSNCNTQSIVNGSEEEHSRSKRSALTVSNDNGNDFDQVNNDSSRMEADTFDKASENYGTEKHGNVTDEPDKRCTENSRNMILEKSANESKQPEKDSSSGHSTDVSRMVVNADNAVEDLKKGCDMADPSTKEASRNSVKILEANSDDCKGFVSSPSRQKTVIDGNATENLDEMSDIAQSEKKDTTSGSLRELTTNMSDLINIGTTSDVVRMKLNSEIKVYHLRRKIDSSTQNDAQLREDGSSLKMDSYHAEREDEKVPGDSGGVINTCNQTGITETEKQPAQFVATVKSDIEEQSASASDQMQNALALLYRKRQQLYSRICNMEDTLALCEDDITRIRDGREVELARECITSLISGKYYQVEDKGNQQGENNGKSQHENHTRLSETYLPGKSCCQDLEYACLKNNWRLPRYLTKSSDGKFLSIVVVEGKDFKLHAKGSFESKPGEARDSAAAEMIVVIRNTSLNESG